MSYLLSISLGPVQDFIAAARKTADLYAGSQLLVAVAREVVKSLPDKQAKFIFPANPDSNGANKILVVVEDPGECVRKAKSAANDLLLKRWRYLLEEYKLTNFVNTDMAESQLANFLEFYAAWTPQTDDYAADRARVEALLAARKSLRDFGNIDQKDAGIPKSPLDPSFACVFKCGKVPIDLPKRLKGSFKATELLDAVSLLKRLEGHSKTDVVSVNELAHEGATAEAKAKSQFKRHAKNEDEDAPAYSYYAILLADGDSMGQKLSELEKQADPQEAHRKFSRQLDDFADQARAIVEDHEGLAVYTGGDDVLAFLPVTQVLQCGQKLSEAFGVGTLSAGVVIAHYREPLSTSLARAREAEKEAKKVDGKNAVCVALHTRGGSPMLVTQKWSTAQDLCNLINHKMHQHIPRGLPYELRELAEEWPENFTTSVLAAEAQRIVNRKTTQNGNKIPEDSRLCIPEDLQNADALLKFSQQLILARFMSGRGDLP